MKITGPQWLLGAVLAVLLALAAWLWLFIHDRDEAHNAAEHMRELLK